MTTKTKGRAEKQFDRFQELVHEFKEAQGKHADKGAADTEPRQVFWHRVADMIDGATLGELLDELPDADSWDLYTSSMRCDAAARALNAKLKKVLRHISNMGPEAVDRVESYYSWELMGQ